MNRLALPICALLAFAVPASAMAEGLCTSDEVAIFNATMKGGDRVVSLCADHADKATWLQARMGRGGQVGRTFPETRAGSLKKFVFRRYTRPRTTYLKLEFDTGGRNYTIFESFDGSENPPDASSLRIRSLAGGNEISDTELVRTTPPLNLMRLENRVTTKDFDE